MHLRLLAALVASLSVPACALDSSNDATEELVESEAADALIAATGSIAVTASYFYAFPPGVTPTYGTEQKPYMTVEIRVDDSALRRAYPGFNGLEKAFLRVPRRADGRLVWETVAVPWKGTGRAGYQGQIVTDIHEVRAVEIDAEAVTSHGIAVGLTTNVGTVWAQQPGQNFRVAKR